MTRAPERQEEAAEILAFHNGDILEALRTMIAERDAAEEWLAVARCRLRGQSVSASPAGRHRR